MTEFTDSAGNRRKILKSLIKQLHEGKAPEQVKSQLERLLGMVPHDDVVAVEQELINEGMSPDEILDLCDIHSRVLHDSLEKPKPDEFPPGHPIHTFRMENRALERKLHILGKLLKNIPGVAGANDLNNISGEIKRHFLSLGELDRHYARKENLLFPFLEKHDITGPPQVMWGKHDEIRKLLDAGIRALEQMPEVDKSKLAAIADEVLQPAVAAVGEMIFKEENILFPMCRETLSEDEWFRIYEQSPEIGFCLYEPVDNWSPQTNSGKNEHDDIESGRIEQPSGSFSKAELKAILNTLPFDLTFVDKDDTVRYFSEGGERIFARNRSVIGRKVQNCHPPKSVHMVEKILDDFKSGRQNRAAFWINMKGTFVSIEYFALRGDSGEYLGTLEVTQDLTEKRGLEGERRLLQY